MKKQVWFLITFLVLHTLPVLAQGDKYIGKWFVSYNEKDRQRRGQEYAIEISQKGLYYILTHVNEDHTISLPPQGTYLLNEAGRLVSGNNTLLLKKEKLVYNDRGFVELISEKSRDEIHRDFIYGVGLLDSADTLLYSGNIDIKKSIDCMNKILAADEHCVECYCNISIAWYRIDNIDSAVAALKKASALDSEFSKVAELKDFYSDYYMRLGWNKYGQFDKFKQAIAEFKKGLALSPFNTEMLYNMGGACFSDKQYKNAVIYFRKCLETKPDHEQAQAGLDAALEKLGKK